MLELQQWVTNLNNAIIIPNMLVSSLTGILFVVTILSMRLFPYTTARPWLIRGYNINCWLMMIGVGINRFVNFPPAFPLSSGLYVLAFMGFTGLVLFAGYQGRKENAKQTIRTKQANQSFS